MDINEDHDADLPPAVGDLLKQIAAEPVPERLLDLARKLQAALNDKARAAADPETEPTA